MGRYKCATCGVEFDTLEEMRAHFSSDWHAHNVKLRVEGKKPISKAAYRDLMVNGGTDATGRNVGNDDKPLYYCSLTGKYFKSVQTLQSHLRSKEHLLAKEKKILARDPEAASALTTTTLGSAALGLHRRAARGNKKKKYVDPDADALKNAVKVPVDEREEDCTEKTCIFDGHKSDTWEENLAYMKKAYNFTLPLEDKCTDKEGLLGYLARKVNGGMSIVGDADSKAFKTLEAVRAHMKQHNHQRIILGPEYQDFYEGTVLDDPDEVVEKREEEVDGQLVVSETTGKRVAKRRQGGMQKFRSENQKQETERRLITQQKAESTALIAQERKTAEAPARIAEQKLQKRFKAAQNKWDMKIGVRGNILHPKGFDGEGLKSGN